MITRRTLIWPGVSGVDGAKGGTDLAPAVGALTAGPLGYATAENPVNKG